MEGRGKGSAYGRTNMPTPKPARPEPATAITKLTTGRGGAECCKEPNCPHHDLPAALGACQGAARPRLALTVHARTAVFRDVRIHAGRPIAQLRGSLRVMVFDRAMLPFVHQLVK